MKKKKQFERPGLVFKIYKESNFSKILRHIIRKGLVKLYREEIIRQHDASRPVGDAFHVTQPTVIHLSRECVRECVHACVCRRNSGVSVYVYVCICGCADDVVNGFRVYVHTASRHLKPNRWRRTRKR